MGLVGCRVHQPAVLPGAGHGVIAIATEGVAATLIGFPGLLVAVLTGMTVPKLVPT
jgi:hypothetical protein